MPISIPWRSGTKPRLQISNHAAYALDPIYANLQLSPRYLIAAERFLKQKCSAESWIAMRDEIYAFRSRIGPAYGGANGLEVFDLRCTARQTWARVFALNGEMFIAIYVDDLLIVGPDMKKIDALKAASSDRFKMTDLGECHFYLGIRIRRHRPAGPSTWTKSATSTRSSLSSTWLTAHRLAYQ